jgi:DNA ligase D-like protein (predicted 3'-phosphoesterase)
MTAARGRASDHRAETARSNVISLDAYRRTRQLKAAGGPAGAGRSTRNRRPRFVVLVHETSTRCYDFQLEVDGVLKSWAVPTGPSTDPREKRLAVATQDRPIDGADIDSLARTGATGSTQVEVWDRGYYQNRSHGKRDEPMGTREALEGGHLSFELHGGKLRGGYSLIRMAGRPEGQWLLIKDATAHRSGRTL